MRMLAGALLVFGLGLFAGYHVGKSDDAPDRSTRRELAAHPTAPAAPPIEPARATPGPEAAPSQQEPVAAPAPPGG